MRPVPLDRHGTYMGQRAVVIGGSIAGLMAAQVLSEHFEEVIVFERDLVEEAAATRKGVPQGRHTHGLLGRGRTIVEGLFPGLLDELVEGGAVRMDTSNDLGWYHAGCWKLQVPTGIHIQTQSRPYLEAGIRRRIRENQRIFLRPQCQVGELISSMERRRIVGVRVEQGGGSRGAAGEEVHAQLVVDAMGRGSQTPRWLEKLGYARPPETVVKVNLGYATRAFRRTETLRRNWRALLVYPSPPHGTRMGILFPVEGSRWMASLIGWVGDHPPDDEHGYLEFARGLEVPDFYKTIAQAQPLSPIETFRFPFSVRRHYDRMHDFPTGLVVLGDAVCSFNPSYGQGMTTSALGVELLQREIRLARASGQSLDSACERLRHGLGRVLQAPWNMAVGEDFLWPQVEGRRPHMNRVINWYFAHVHELVGSDPGAVVRFMRVANMVDPLHKIFSPYMLSRVALRALLPGHRRGVVRLEARKE